MLQLKMNFLLLLSYGHTQANARVHAPSKKKVLAFEYGYKSDYSFLESVISIALREEKVENAVFSVVFVDNVRIPTSTVKEVKTLINKI